VELESFTVLVTSFHNIQYQALVWFYHRNRYHRNDRATDQYGIAPRISSRPRSYLLAGIAFTVAYRLTGCRLGSYPGCTVWRSATPLVSKLTWTDLATGFLGGFARQHYFLDQYIWKVRSDPALSRDRAFS
jgi:hypothetical protein